MALIDIVGPDIEKLIHQYRIEMEWADKFDLVMQQYEYLKRKRMYASYHRDGVWRTHCYFTLGGVFTYLHAQFIIPFVTTSNFSESSEVFKGCKKNRIFTNSIADGRHIMLLGPDTFTGNFNYLVFKGGRYFWDSFLDWVGVDQYESFGVGGLTGEDFPQMTDVQQSLINDWVVHGMSGELFQIPCDGPLTFWNQELLP